MKRLLLTLSACAFLGACTAEARTPTEQVNVTIHYSRFDPASLEFAAGTTVTFTITNTDPIDHEFIVGDQQTQDRHESGKHATHGAIPGEVSVPAGTTRSTTYTFIRPGRLIVGCHLPNHYGYGMRADIRVS